MAFRRELIVAALVGLASAPVLAVPTTVTYAGILEDAGGPVNATVDVEFTIFDDEIAGAVLYNEDDPGTVVLDGQLIVEIGKNNLDDAVLDAPNLFLEVRVDTDVLAPRTRLSSVPFALRAAKAERAAVADVADALGSLAEADVVTHSQLITLHLDNGVAAGTGLTFVNGTLSIASGGVGLTQLAPSSVDSSKIVDGSVATADLTSGAVDSSKILDGTIANADISATAGITGSKLAASTVTSTQLGTSAVTTAKIAASAVDETKLARNRGIFVVSDPGCVESVGTLMTSNTCTRDSAGCTGGQCRNCADNVCAANNCGITFCFNDPAGFIVGP
jgi:hypothetical protein